MPDEVLSSVARGNGNWERICGLGPDPQRLLPERGNQTSEGTNREQ